MLMTIRLLSDSLRYMEFTMLKLFRFLVAMYGYVRRDLSGSFRCNCNSIVHQFIDNLYDFTLRRAVSLLVELLLLREGKFQLHYNDSRLLSHNETDDIIGQICIP
jgi:hypothetical protein